LSTLLLLFTFAVMAVTVINFLAARLIYFTDLNAYGCYKFGFKNSPYALATGVSKWDLKHDKGLVGEFKGYVLSKSLKVPHKILYNVCVPMPNGNFQEVDCIIITGSMIYVIECKNRGGNFVGRIDDEVWTQFIGRQQNPTGNIYIQNEKHVMAVNRFLLDKDIVPNGVNVCTNVLLFVGQMGIDIDRKPLDFMYGDLKHIKKYIEQNEKLWDDGTDTTEIVEEIYDALLPYSLYTPAERKRMMDMRDARKAEFELGDFKQVVVPEGIPGVTEPGEEAVIRYNNVYTQLLFSNGATGKNYSTCWQTRTDIPAEYLR